MTIPRWLDRIWLCAIAFAWLFMVPIWALLWFDKDPWLGSLFLVLIGLSVWNWVTEPPKTP